MHALKLSQRDVAQMLGWSHGRLAKILSGRVRLLVDDLAAISFALSLTPREVLRDRGLEFDAEMTPIELRILERLREYERSDRQQYDALVYLMQVRPSPTPERFATSPKKSLYGKPRPR